MGRDAKESNKPPICVTLGDAGEVIEVIYI